MHDGNALLALSLSVDCFEVNKAPFPTVGAFTVHVKRFVARLFECYLK